MHDFFHGVTKKSKFTVFPFIVFDIHYHFHSGFTSRSYDKTFHDGMKIGKYIGRNCWLVSVISVHPGVVLWGVLQ